MRALQDVRAGLRWAEAMRSPGMALALAALAGCSVPSFKGAQPATSVIPPVVDCQSLAGLRFGADRLALPTKGVLLTNAAPVAAAAASGAQQAVAAHCKVLGEILPVDAAAPAIRFQVNVPTAWTGGAIQVGGGGLNGSIPANLAALGGGGSPVSGAQPPDAPYPINRGYAMFGGDSGHQGEDGRWALNEEARVNFGHAALKKTHDAAFAVIQALHGRLPQRSYFMGQSQGGREALEVAQRYPADYDGVLATAPLIGYGPHVMHKALLAGMQTGAGWISPAKAKAVEAEVMRQCDALDGLADGVVGNYLDCARGFDPALLRCAGGVDTGPRCLSDPQLATLAAMSRPLRFGFDLAHGWREFPGYALLGREGVAWLNTTPQPQPGMPPALGQPGTTVQYVILQDAAADLLKFKVDDHRAAIQAASALIDSTRPDLSGFFARGGRLIVKSNAADYAVNPQILARWFERLRQQHGDAAVDDHSRWYMLPGAGHGGNGVRLGTTDAIPDRVDLVSLLLDWVEQGAMPPDAPVLRAMAGQPPFAVSATRPLCRYPLYPAWQGGDMAQAASYRCQRPQGALSSRAWVVDGDLRLDVRVDVGPSGEGQPIVLLPSSRRDSLDFDTLAQGLAQRGFKVLRPQPRGMGDSSAPPSDLTMTQLAADVALVIRRLGGGQPAVVVGHAYGNWVARVTDQNHPAQVRGVVVLGAAAWRFPPGLAESLALAADPAQPEAQRIAALQRSMFAPGNDARPWLQGWYPQWAQAYAHASTHPPRDSWYTRPPHSPMLDLQADQDAWRPPATRNELRALLGDRVTVRSIPGAGHALVPERPAEIAAEIAAWARQLP